MTHPVCAKCGKELYPESGGIFQKTYYLKSFPDVGVSKMIRWREVDWQRRNAQQAKRAEPRDEIEGEITLCTLCAEQFREKIKWAKKSSDIFLAGIVLFFALVIFMVSAYLMF
jgi:hypothetical protein